MAADEVSADTDVAWTGRTMKVPWFAEHMREELVLAARVLLLWGRRPANPARICSRVGPEALGRVRRPLSGY